LRAAQKRKKNGDTMPQHSPEDGFPCGNNCSGIDGA
jgi:hypothetical protein